MNNVRVKPISKILVTYCKQPEVEMEINEKCQNMAMWTVSDDDFVEYNIQQ